VIEGVHEQRRLRALAELETVDGMRDGRLDDLASLAARVCDAPYSFISLVDEHREVHKAAFGLDLFAIPRELGVSTPAVEHAQFFEVEDVTRDPRLALNPLVADSPNVRSYAAVPLQTEHGYTVGTLCVLDTRSRRLNREQIQALSTLARQVIFVLEQRSSAARHAQEQHSSRILHSASDYAIFSMDLQGAITTWNDGAHRILGWDAAEVRGQLGELFSRPKIARPMCRSKRLHRVEKWAKSR
jgi:GAF domain-containing protein